MKGMDMTNVETVSPRGLDLQERVIEINRVAKVVKGGRRFSFTALVAAGDEEGVVGIGYGKAREVPLAIQKAVENARKSLIRVPKYGQTLTHKIIGRYGAGHVVLRPASPGTGVIAGGGVRAVLELGGVRDVLTKSIGTQNPINLVKATMDGLVRLRRPEEVAELRGLTVAQVLGVQKTNGGATTVSGGDGRGSGAAAAGPRPGARVGTPQPRVLSRTMGGHCGRATVRPRPPHHPRHPRVRGRSQWPRPRRLKPRRLRMPQPRRRPLRPPRLKLRSSRERGQDQAGQVFERAQPEPASDALRVGAGEDRQRGGAQGFAAAAGADPGRFPPGRGRRWLRKPKPKLRKRMPPASARWRSGCTT